MSSDNALKRLHERDPVLFDLKKYNQNASVYSVICQSNRQPLIYDEEEKNMLSASEQSKLTKYHNYTMDTPAYYGCPNPEYPYLNLKKGVHPMGYDIPCCKKIPSSTKITTQSKHILTYGKDIPLGRLAFPPSEIKDELLLGLDQEYRIVGVRQSTPSVPEAGFAFSLIALLPHGALMEMAEQVRASQTSYMMLGSGSASVFESAAQLADYLLTSFSDKHNCFTSFSPGEFADYIWIDILIDIVREVFDIEIIFLNDINNNGSIVLEAASIRNASIIIIIKTETGYFPLVEVDSKQNIAATIFAQTSKINKYIMSVLKNRKTSRLNYPDYSNICAFEERNELGFKIDKLLIDKQNKCYTIILINKDGLRVYFPIYPSPIPKDDRNIYGLFDEGVYPKALLLECVTEFNLINNARVPISRTLLFNDKYIGFDAHVGDATFNNFTRNCFI